MSEAAKVCAGCGALIPGDEVANLMTGKQRAVFEVVRKAGRVGISNMSVQRAVWPKGTASQTLVLVTIRCINKKIEGEGLAIRGRRGPGSVFKLIKI